MRMAVRKEISDYSTNVCPLQLSSPDFVGIVGICGMRIALWCREKGEDVALLQLRLCVLHSRPPNDPMQPIHNTCPSSMMPSVAFCNFDLNTIEPKVPVARLHVSWDELLYSFVQSD